MYYIVVEVQRGEKVKKEKYLTSKVYMGSKDNSFLGTLKRKYGEENELVLFMATQLVRACAAICSSHVWFNAHFVAAVYRSHTSAREVHVRVSVASHPFYRVCLTGFAVERGELLHRCV